MNTYRYELTCSDSLDNGIEVPDIGIIAATSYEEAITALHLYYGHIIEFVHLKQIADNGIMELDKELIDKIEDNYVW